MSVTTSTTSEPGLHRDTSSPRQPRDSEIFAARGSAMPTSEIDRVFRAATERGDVPGVVAMAATRDGDDLSGRVRPAGLARRCRDDAGYGVLDRFDDQGDHVDSGDAAGRAGQAVARPADRRRAAGNRRAASARRLRCRRRAAAAPGKAADHPAPSAHPHRRLRLRHLECRYGPLHGAERRPRHHLLPGGGVSVATGLRAGREMGLRHQHRLGRQGGRAGQAGRSSAIISPSICSRRSA